MHLCWGNWHGPHHRDISIEKIFKVIDFEENFSPFKHLTQRTQDWSVYLCLLSQIVMSAKPGILLFESANPRHAHEVDIFESLKHLIPEDKV